MLHERPRSQVRASVMSKFISLARRSLHSIFTFTPFSQTLPRLATATKDRFAHFHPAQPLPFVHHSIFSPRVLRVTFSARFSPTPASSLSLCSSNNAFFFHGTFFVSRCTCFTRVCARIKTQATRGRRKRSSRRRANSDEGYV